MVRVAKQKSKNQLETMWKSLNYQSKLQGLNVLYSIELFWIGTICIEVSTNKYLKVVYFFKVFSHFAIFSFVIGIFPDR